MSKRNTKSHRLAGVVSFSAIMLFGTVDASGQSYPDKSVTVVVPYAPGGLGDLTSRLVAGLLSEKLRQNFVVENRAGASETIGTAAVIRSKPDGYTIGMTSNASALNPAVMKVPFDILKDVAPVSLAVSYGYVLVASPSLRVDSMQDLIALAKSKPEGIVAGTGGQTTTLFLTQLGNSTGLKFTILTYSGSAPARTALLGDQVQVLFDTLPTAEPLVKAGKLRALGLTSNRDKFGDAPPIGKFVPGFDFSGWIGFVVPVGTPRPVVELLNREIKAAVTSPSAREKLEKLGVVPVGGTPDEFTAQMKRDLDIYAKLAKQAGIAVE